MPCLFQLNGIVPHHPARATSRLFIKNGQRKSSPNFIFNPLLASFPLISETLNRFLQFTALFDPFLLLFLNLVLKFTILCSNSMFLLSKHCGAHKQCKTSIPSTKSFWNSCSRRRHNRKSGCKQYEMSSKLVGSRRRLTGKTRLTWWKSHSRTSLSHLRLEIPWSFLHTEGALPTSSRKWLLPRCQRCCPQSAPSCNHCHTFTWL